MTEKDLKRVVLQMDKTHSNFYLTKLDAFNKPTSLSRVITGDFLAMMITYLIEKSHNGTKPVILSNAEGQPFVEISISGYGEKKPVAEASPIINPGG